MCAIMAEVGPIAKSRQNKTQGYQFRGIDEVYEALQGIMAAQKVFSLPTVLEQVREERVNKSGGANIYSILRIKYTFYTDDGSSVDCVVVGEGMDNGDKASNKGMSVAHKYALIQAFSIPTREAKDPENDSHDVLPTFPTPIKAVPINDEPGAATIPFEKSNQFGARIDSLSEKELESMANFLGKLKPPISPKTADFKVAFDSYIEWKFGRAK